MSTLGEFAREAAHELAIGVQQNPGLINAGVDERLCAHEETIFADRRYPPISGKLRASRRVRATFMRSTALAIEAEYDEVLVSSTGVLEANIAAVRDSLNDFKTEVRADFRNVKEEIKSVKQEIKSVREDLTDEIKSVREEVKSVRDDLSGEIKSVREDLTGEIKSVRDDLSGEIKSVREDLTCEIKSVRDDLSGDIKCVREEIKSAKEGLLDEIKSIREKSDKTFERFSTRFDTELKETNRALSELSKAVLRIDSRQGAVLWVLGGLGALITVAISVGKAFKWF